MADGRGGARPGAGRKKKPLAEKILEGNPGKRDLKKIVFPAINTEKMLGEEMPEIADYLRQRTKNSTKNVAPAIFKKTWKWLNERNCHEIVKNEMLEQYAMYVSRWVQCEEGINIYGLLAKHPTTGMPIASPFVSMGVKYLKEANLIWSQIYQIVKENCETQFAANNPNDSIMEQLLTGKM